MKSWEGMRGDTRGMVTGSSSSRLIVPDEACDNIDGTVYSALRLVLINIV